MCPTKTTKMEKEQKEFDRLGKMLSESHARKIGITGHPYDLSQKGLAYDKLKEQRDELLEVLREGKSLVKDLINEGSVSEEAIRPAEFVYEAEQTIKNCEND